MSRPPMARGRRSLLPSVLIGALVMLGADGKGGADSYRPLRERMVAEQIRARAVSSRKVLSAMELVPRHLFVPPQNRDQAYEDHPVPIGWGQTISQPYIVALMTELLDLQGSERVLEIGTGSGYHAAVLSRVAREVYSIEILEELGEQARSILAQLGYDNVHIRIGDGYQGWPEKAPFDAIILTAAPERIPQPLLDQLRIGGRMVAPVGSFFQDLQVIRRTSEGVEKQVVAPVRFVPMVGRAQDGGKDPGG